ncbi:MAG: ABC transporter substrate-binding protein, partial [Trebonia sp.]
MTTRIDDDQVLRVSACLSLTGRFARFGAQALKALQTWQSFDEKTELIIEDDESSPQVVERVFPDLARRCDVLLGPYSTQLVRTAGRIAATENVIMWNHGGSGDDIQAAGPGHVISILTPTTRYADPFVRHLKENYGSAKLFVNSGKGAFGRQVADGATRSAEQAGIDFLRVSRSNKVNWPPVSSSAWDLF